MIGSELTGNCSPPGVSKILLACWQRCLGKRAWDRATVLWFWRRNGGSWGLCVVYFWFIYIFPWRLTFSLCFFFTSSFFLSTNSVVVFVVCFWAFILVVLFCYLCEFWGVVFCSTWDLGWTIHLLGLASFAWVVFVFVFAFLAQNWCVEVCTSARLSYGASLWLFWFCTSLFTPLPVCPHHDWSLWPLTCL